jgi:hypothetical protein
MAEGEICEFISQNFLVFSKLLTQFSQVVEPSSIPWGGYVLQIIPMCMLYNSLACNKSILFAVLFLSLINALQEYLGGQMKYTFLMCMNIC